MHLLRALAKRSAIRFGLRDLATQEDADLDLLAANDSGDILESLELTEDDRAVREYDWWIRPERIVITDATERRLRWLQSSVSNVHLIGVRWTDDSIVEACQSADALIGWCTGPMIAASKRLRWLQLRAAGVEKIIDLPELVNRELIVTNLQRTSGPIIAEHAFAMLLCLTRGMYEHFDAQRKGRWHPSIAQYQSRFILSGRTILIAGLGGVGAEIARRAHHFGMRVLGICSTSVSTLKCLSKLGNLNRLSEFAAEADVIVNALPLTESTRTVFDARVFSRAKRGAIFVNVGRGKTTDTSALVSALRDRQLNGAALDVVDPEPLGKNHPLWHMRNVIITPHVAGIAVESTVREWILIRENLRRYVAGDAMLSVVNRTRGY